MEVLEIRNVTYNYSNSKEKVLSAVNQKFELGKFYAIVGKSGTGKSTLLSLLAGLDNPKSGKILFQNEDIEKKGYSNHRKNNISLVFQNYNLIDYLSPIENVRLVNKDASEDILLELGLDRDQINRNVMKLSGGQQQRVAIARALVSHAPIILADEPTGNLDDTTASEIIEILKKLAKERNKCVIVVTHSKEVAKAADTVLELQDKKLRQVRGIKLIKNALAYVTRKSLKSLIILLVVLSMSTLSLISLSIKDATNKASEETFGNITNSFSMEINRQVNPGTPRGAGNVKGEDIKKISDSEEIDGYVKRINSVADLVDNDIIETEETLSNLSEERAKNFKRTVMLTGVNDSSKETKFVSGAYTLVEGSHLENQDKNKILMHTDLAKKNNLKIGDKIKIKSNLFDADNEKGADETVEVEIKGLF